MLQKNEHNTDRLVRALIGVVLTAVGLLVTTGIASIVLYVLAAIMFVTALLGFCPIYKIFGLSTCPMKPKE